MMKILIADDHSLNREFTRMLLESNYPNAVILEADDYRATELACRKHHPTLIILDIFMPGTSGLLGSFQIIRQFPQSKILVCSAIDNPTLMQIILSSGAKGFIPKTMSSKEFMQGVNLVLNDGRYIPNSIADGHSIHFTTRQLEILGMLCSGLSNKEIASQLDISTHTVKLHVSSVLESLNVQNRLQAMALCGLHPSNTQQLQP